MNGNPVTVTRQELVEWYVEEQRSLYDIADKLECSASSVLRKLRKYEIQTRKRGKKNKSLKNKTIQLVFKFRHKRTEQLDLLTHISKNLYNQGNYIVRQEYIRNGVWVRYSGEDDKTLYKELKGTENYVLLKAGISQQTLQMIDKNWRSFFNAKEDWKQHPSKYTGRPNLPRYLDKDGRFLITCMQADFKIRNNEIVITMSEGFKKEYPDHSEPIRIPIPDYELRNPDTYKQVRIIPKRNYFEIELVYRAKITKKLLDKSRFVGVDLGLDNLITMAENRNVRPLILSGRPLKYLNRKWNKRRARLLSIKDKQKMKWTDQLERITNNRNARISDYMHKTSQFLIDYCLDNNIGNIVIGRLKNIKQEITLGKRNNQNFVFIPLEKLKAMIKYKALLMGIKVYEINESYTSKCSSLDLEPLKRHKKYIGRRIKGVRNKLSGSRLYKGSNYILNADVNGALNILRKVIGDDFIRNLADTGNWFSPVRIRDLSQTSYERFHLHCVKQLSNEFDN